MLSTNGFTKQVWCLYAHLLPLTPLPASVEVGVPQDFYMEGQWFGRVKPLFQVEICGNIHNLMQVPLV